MGEQTGAAGLHDPRLHVGGVSLARREGRLGRSDSSSPASALAIHLWAVCLLTPGAAGAVRQQLARLCPRDPLVGRLPAHARLPGDGGHALAGADELDEPLSPAGREP